MQAFLKLIRVGGSALALAIALTAVSPAIPAFAQAPAATSLSESTIKSLQEALNKQGIAIPANGVLNDETRAAIRQYQSQHHLPVTGEPDKATLDKLGVRQSAVPAQSSTVAQAAPTSAQPGSPSAPGQSAAPPAPGGGMMGGGMMSGGMTGCPMMQGQMQGMMQMMQGMSQMMRTAAPAAAPPASQATPPTPGNAPEQMQAMMQIMQGMMQMMQTMQAQMQPSATQPGQMRPGQMPGSR